MMNLGVGLRMKRTFAERVETLGSTRPEGLET